MANPSLDRQLQELLAKNIREARQKLGISQMELAKRADISAGHMNDIEACRRWVSAITFARIAHELHVKPYQLLLEKGDESLDKYDLLTDLLSDLRKGVDTEIERVITGHLTEGRKKTTRR